MIGKILVSACLTGAPVRYDGRAKAIREALLDQWRDEGRLVIVCPEVAANLSAFLWARRLNKSLAARLCESLAEQNGKLVHG